MAHNLNRLLALQQTAALLRNDIGLFSRIHDHYMMDKTNPQVSSCEVMMQLHNFLNYYPFRMVGKVALMNLRLRKRRTVGIGVHSPLTPLDKCPQVK